MDFFCDFCGAIVKENEKRCSSCGLEFSNTKCSVCGLIGPTKLFRKGCPECRRLAKQTKLDKKKSIRPQQKLKEKRTLYEKIRSTKLLSKLLFLFFLFDILLIWYITYVQIFS